MQQSIVNCAISSTLLLVSAAAEAAFISNGSFESATIDPGAFTTLAVGSTAIDDWTVIQSTIDYIGTGWDASDGLRSVDLGGGIGSAGGIQQTFSTTAGTDYLVSFDMAGNWGGAPTIKTLTVAADGQSADFNFDITGTSAMNMGWTNKIWQFTADDTSATLQFLTSDANFGPAIDNVSVNIAPVPIPAAIWLFGAALGLAGLMRRMAPV